MRPIPIKMREELSEDPRMKHCVCLIKVLDFVRIESNGIMSGFMQEHKLTKNGL